MKSRFKKAWQWLRKHLINKETFVFLIIAELIFWSPSIVMGFMAIFISPYYWGVFGAYTAFWAIPITPAIPIQLMICFGLKNIWKRRGKKIEKQKHIENSD